MACVKSVLPAVTLIVLCAQVSVAQVGAPQLAGQLVNSSFASGAFSATLQVRNIGTGAASNITITSMPLRSLAGSGTPGLQSPSLPLNLGSLAPGASTTVPVTVVLPGSVTRFSIGQTGSFSDSGGDTRTFALSQMVNVPAQTPTQPALSASPSALAFGSLAVGQTSGTQSIQLSNTGTANLSFTGISVTGVNAGDFAIVANGCGASLAPGANCSVGIRFAPAGAGARTAAVSVVSNAPGSPHSFALSGTGTVTRTLSFSPGSLTFTGVIVGANSQGQAVTVSNTGNAAVNFSSVGLSGGHAADFPVVSNSCGVTLIPGASCSVSVGFAPSAPGSRASALVFVSDAQGSPHSISLSGTGIAATKILSSNTGGLSFGTVLTGASSSLQTVTLSSTGNTAVNLSGFTLAGTAAADFSLTANNCPSALASGASCSVAVIFSPAAAGSRQANLIISNDASGGNIVVDLSGTGQQTSRSLTLNPASLDFGTRNVNTTSSGQVVTVTSSGNSAVAISSIALAGGNTGDFSIASNSCPSTLPAGSACSVSITFTPTVNGARSAQLVVISDGNGSPQSVALSGSGVTPTKTLTLSPASLDYGTQNTGTTSGAQGFTVTNTGNTAVAISSIALGGANANQFAIASNNCPSSLNAGAACSVSLTFSPTTAGAKSASAVVTSDGTGSPQSVALSGSGVTPTKTLTLSPASLDYGTQNTGTTSGAQGFTSRTQAIQRSRFRALRWAARMQINLPLRPIIVRRA